MSGVTITDQEPGDGNADVAIKVRSHLSSLSICTMISDVAINGKLEFLLILVGMLESSSQILVSDMA